VYTSFCADVFCLTVRGDLCLCTFMGVCAYECIHKRQYARIDVYMYVHMYVCVRVCVCVYIYIYMYVCMYVWMHLVLLYSFGRQAR